MRTIRSATAILATLSLTLIVASSTACGVIESVFGDESGSGSGPGSSSGGPGFGDGGDGSSGGPGGLVGPACATSTAGGQAGPMYLVFMFDRSGSMKFNPSPNNKWDSVVSGLTSFFADAQSAGLFASEQVFPKSTGCDSVASYQTPLVAATALPDTTGILASTLSSNGPDPNFNTPTDTALQGAVAYAQSLQATGKKTAVVLVTDGDPQGCSADVPKSAAAAGAALPGIRTYVIGVGDSLTNLNAIAAGGGTSSAILISTSNPSAITSNFVTALNVIRSQTIACEYTLPAPPSGETLDVNRVNVQFTPKGGTLQTLDYNANCTGGVGWHYDDPSAPTKILMCNDTCTNLLANADGKIDIVFGCTTQGALPR